MKRTFTSEEIINSLPDYVNSSLNDPELVQEIESRALQDKSLRDQIIELQTTFVFLSSSDFSPPPDNYFSNLPVRINERIGTKDGVTWWKELGTIWKLAIPAIAIVIVALVFFVAGQKSPENQLATDTGKSSNNAAVDIKKEDAPRVIAEADSHGTVDELEEVAERELRSPKLNFSRIAESTIDFDTQSISDPMITVEQKQVMADNIEEESEAEVEESGILLGSTDSEEPVVDEFLELSTDEQKEILEILKNS